MPTPHQPDTRTFRSFNEVESAAGQRVPISKVRARRRWVIRTMLMLSVTAVMMFIFVAWQRDNKVIEAQIRIVETSAKALQEKIDEWGTLPVRIPELEKMSYVSDADRFYAMKASEPVIVAVAPKVELILRENGRCVIVYHQGKVEAKWMTMSEFLAAWLSQEHRIKDFEK